MNELIPLLAKHSNETQLSTNSQERLLAVFWALPVKTIAEVLAAYNTAEKTLGGIARQYGEGKVRAFLTLALMDFQKFFSVDRKMGAEQIKQTVGLLLEEVEFRNLTLEDMKVFLNKCKKGEYGEIYGRIDGQMILKWLWEYWNERVGMITIQNECEAFSRSGPDNRQLTVIQVNELIDKNIKRQ